MLGTRIAYLHIFYMPQGLPIYSQKRGFILWYSFVVITSNVNLDGKPSLQLFAIALCACAMNHSTENYESGSASKFTFEAIVLAVITEQYSNYKCKRDRSLFNPNREISYKIL